MRPVTWPDLVGSAGAGIIVAAYWRNQRGRLASDDWRFPAANLGGSLLILFSLSTVPNLPSVLIELFWSAISAYGTVRAWQRRARSRDTGRTE